MMGLAIPLGIALLTGSGFILNEWSEGALAQTMGVGHHHMSTPHAHCGATDEFHGNHGSTRAGMHAPQDCSASGTGAPP